LKKKTGCFFSSKILHQKCEFGIDPNSDRRIRIENNADKITLVLKLLGSFRYIVVCRKNGNERNTQHLLQAVCQRHPGKTSFFADPEPGVSVSEFSSLSAQ
jgi:hypothetical protein